MTTEPETWRSRQRRVMGELRGAQSQAETALAAGLTYWRYTRMEEGETALPAEYLRPLARAYDVPLSTLLEKLGLTDTAEAAPYSPRAEMEASGVVPPHRVDQVEADVAGRDERDQRARVAVEIQMQTELRTQASASSPSAKQPRQPRQRHIS